MKKIIIGITIFLISFLIIFFSINSKGNKKEKQNNNISIILETEEGNIESNTFPDKGFYEFNNIVCENTNDNITPTFNSETWKLNLSVEEESIDGNFNCVIYFKHTPRIASDYIVSKYTENNYEGLIRINQPATEQTESLTEYRYSGSNDVVKNYVNFNNETWRIIGVFPTEDGNGNIENRVKIIREESIGNYSWDTSASGVNDFVSEGTQYYGGGVNQWGESGSYEGADLMRLLNPGYEDESINNSLYWNRESGTCYNGRNNATTTCNFTSVGLNNEAKTMIEDSKWYTAAIDHHVIALEAYMNERGSNTGLIDSGISINKTTSWIGKVGLLYPSDFGYASNSCRNGTQILSNYNNVSCANTNWLSNDDFMWMISPRLSSSMCAISRQNANGVLVTSGDVYFRGGVFPVTYLSSSVKITGGTGTINDMYELSL